MKTNNTSLISKLITVALIVSLMPMAAFTDVFANNPVTPSGTQVAPVQTNGFTDLSRSHPNYVAIMYLTQIGVLKGYSDNTFHPDDPINRAEVLKVILQGSNIEAPEDFDEPAFSDVLKDQWFARFVMKARAIGIVKGDAESGDFSPARQVNKAEFLKMLLMANQINAAAVPAPETPYSDVPQEAWFAPYVNYAARLGIITQNSQGLIQPSNPLTRGEVAQMMYLLMVIQKGTDTQFLLHRAEAEMAQIEIYIAANRVPLAKNASELAVDLTQQALKMMPENNVVLGAAKLARAYDYLVDSFILGVQKQNEQSAEVANQAIKKATEAWEANNATQPIARHIKDRAREILAQVGGTEGEVAPTTPAAPAQ